jgi:hypothetical protein
MQNDDEAQPWPDRMIAHLKNITMCDHHGCLLSYIPMQLGRALFGHAPWHDGERVNWTTVTMTGNDHLTIEDIHRMSYQFAHDIAEDHKKANRRRTPRRHYLQHSPEIEQLIQDAIDTDPGEMNEPSYVPSRDEQNERWERQGYPPSRTQDHS